MKKYRGLHHVGNGESNAYPLDYQGVVIYAKPKHPIKWEEE